MQRVRPEHNRGFAAHGWLGLLLVAVAWPLNWGLPGLRTHLLFFPLWLGYVLVMDALVLRRRGTSLFTRSRRRFVLLFVALVVRLIVAVAFHGSIDVGLQIMHGELVIWGITANLTRRFHDMALAGEAVS